MRTTRRAARLPACARRIRGAADVRARRADPGTGVEILLTVVTLGDLPDVLVLVSRV